MINHQYYTLSANLYPKIVQGLQMSQRISPQEANWLLQQLNTPAFDNFIHNMIAQVPCVNGEQHLERLIIDNFISQLIAQSRQNHAAWASAGGGGMYFRPNVGGGYGGGGYPAGNPALMTGGGGGWYTGNRGGRPMGGFSPRYAGPRGPQPKQQQQQTQTPKKEEKKLPPWKEPVNIPEEAFKIENPSNVSFMIQKFNGFDGAQLIEAFVVDGRPIYRNDAEAIAAYKTLFNEDETSRKFLTVCYRQLKTIKVDRIEFAALVKSVAIAVGNVSESDPAGRVKAILATVNEHARGAANAFEKLIVDEFNVHALCGELTDATKGHLDWKVTISNLNGLYEMLTGSLPKQTRESLHQIKNFDEALKRIVSKVINTVVVNGTSHRILDPINDKSIMDIYGRAVPPVWKNDKTNEWIVTGNFFTKYLASKKTVNGSETDASRAAAQSLQTTIGLVDKNYAVVQVPRIITWCNCPSSAIVGWNESGKCIPRVFSVEDINNDTAYFLNRAIARILKSKLTNYADVPKKIVCEVDESSIGLDYGITSDGGLWCGSLRYNYD